MKLFRSLIVLAPFFFSLTHGMEVPMEVTSEQGIINSKLMEQSNKALNSFVSGLYKCENLLKCKEACNEFSKQFKIQHSREFHNLLTKFWEPKFAENCGLAEAACVLWKSEIKQHAWNIANDKEGNIPKLYAAAIEIKIILEEFHSSVEKNK